MSFTVRSPEHLKITQFVESPRDQWHRDRRVPMIRMRGEWLAENGFVAGERVVVTIERGRITLTLASEA